MVAAVFISPIISASRDREKAIIEQDAKPVNATGVSLKTANGYEAIFNALLESRGYTEASLKKDQEVYAKQKADGNRQDGGGVMEYERAASDGAPSANGESDSTNTYGLFGSDDSAAMDTAALPSEEISRDFSDTNNQVEGVQEADIIKSDGKYIYAINSEKLNIIEANGANPKLVASVKQHSDKGEIYFEMALTKTRLIAFKEGRDKNCAAEKSKRSLSESDYNGSDRITGIDIFDITNPSNPKKLNSLTQSGSYNESRVIGDYLYLISNYNYVNIMAARKDKPETYVPAYTEDGALSIAAPEDIIMPPDRSGENYTIISGIDISGKGKFVSKKSALGSYPTVYASDKNIYLAVQDWKTREVKKSNYTIITEYDSTIFTRLSINKGDVKLEASSRVPGMLLNQFSMDEYNDVLRAVMTNSRYTYTDYRGVVGAFYDDIGGGGDDETTNSVYTLDMNLNILGSITGLAKDERIYSVRFTGGTAYFVTFRETDPLFSVDLSDPKNPKILGALKIPGFSDYLHPYDEGLLFGIGEERSSDGEDFKGIKLSMFDNSDPADVTEKSKLVLGEYDSTAVSENHKAILVNSEKSLIAFPANDEYVICNYGKTGFEVVKKIRLESGAYNRADEDYDYWNSQNAIRGMFIENYFYVISPRSVSVFDMNDDYKKVGGAVISRTALPVDRYEYESFCYDYGDSDIIYEVE
jgi:uncharacterized secreted protein with C-terminal beta-propeller domain